MPVIRDMALQIDPAELLRREGGGDHQEIRETAHWAAAHCAKLAEPALSFEHHLSPQPLGRGLLINEFQLEIGPQHHLVADAREVVTAMATLGRGLDQGIASCQARGQTLEAYLLGCAAHLALDQVAMHLAGLVEDLAADRGWGVGPALSPGAVAGWSMEDQPALCSLANASAVGVQVGETFLLRPKYSLSLLIGLGPDYSEHKVAATCRYCALGKTCQYRSTDSPH